MTGAFEAEVALGERFELGENERLDAIRVVCPGGNACDELALVKAR